MDARVDRAGTMPPWMYAIVFGSGRVTIPQMCRAGFWLNLIGILVVTGISYLFVVRFLRIGG